MEDKSTSPTILIDLEKVRKLPGPFLEWVISCIETCDAEMIETYCFVVLKSVVDELSVSKFLELRGPERIITATSDISLLAMAEVSIKLSQKFGCPYNFREMMCLVVAKCGSTRTEEVAKLCVHVVADMDITRIVVDAEPCLKAVLSHFLNGFHFSTKLVYHVVNELAMEIYTKPCVQAVLHKKLLSQREATLLIFIADITRDKRFVKRATSVCTSNTWILQRQGLMQGKTVKIPRQRFRPSTWEERFDCLSHHE